MAKDLKYIRKRKRKYGYAFLIEIPYKDEDGNQKRYTNTIKILDYGDEKTALFAAQRMRNEALQQIQSGKLKTIYPSIKLLYTAKWKLLPLSLATHDKHDSVYKQSIISIENKTIEKITISDIQMSLNDYAETHSDDQTSRLMTIWRQLYKTASILGYEIVDRTNGVVIPKSKLVVKHRNVQMEMSDFLTVLDGLLEYTGFDLYNNRGIWFMLLIMYYTGCRPSEALALTRDDISANWIDINKEVGSTRTEYTQIIPPKADSIRKVPISSDLRPILDQMIEWSDHYYLLADDKGNLRDIDDISKVINAVAKKHGVKFFSYMLRHQLSSDLIAENPVAARDILGHSSFGMTLSYARATDAQLHEAVKHRAIAELQPKNKNVQPLSTAVIRRYQIMKLCTVMRFCAILKGLSG